MTKTIPWHRKAIQAAFATAIIAVPAGLAVGLAGPAAAMVPKSSAQDTIHGLQGQGNRVIVNKVGTGPLSQCSVTGVRRGTEVRVLPPRLLQPGPRYTTVYVDVVYNQ